MNLFTSTTIRKYVVNIPSLIRAQLELVIHPRKENIFIIIDLIYSKNQYFKSESQKEYGYSEIPKVLFQSQLKCKASHLTEDINFLVDAGYILRNDWYDRDNGKCKGYKIASEYLSTLEKVEITSPKLKKIREAYWLELQNTYVPNLEVQKHHYFKKTKIRYKEAIECINLKLHYELKALLNNHKINYGAYEIQDLIESRANYQGLKYLIMESKAKNDFLSIMHRHMQYQVAVEKINDGYLYFKRNKTNGRLDHNITSLPSFLRRFIDYNKNLFQIDLKSSQPFFLFTMIKDQPEIDKAELAKYGALVISGDSNQGLYEYLAEEAVEFFNKPVDKDSRTRMKKLTFKVYYSKVPSYKEEKKFYGSHFPTILKYIDKCKENNYTDFAIKLQKIESTVILDTIMPKLKKLGIIPITIHDSFICDGDESSTVINVINETMMEMFNCNPNLHTEYLDSDAIEDRNDNDEHFDFDLLDDQRLKAA